MTYNSYMAIPPVYNVSEARSSISELLDKAEQGEVFISRHGKPVAALISAAHYQELIETLEGLEDALLTERAKACLRRIEEGEATLSFEEVFGEKQ